MTSSSRSTETLFFQNVAGQLYFQPAGFVRLVWNEGRTQLEDIQRFYEQALELMVTSGTHKILSFHGQRAPLSAAAQQCITGNWIPRAMERAGARYCAIVEGADPLHRLSTQSVVATAPAGLTFKRFDNTAAAEEWLHSKA